jgi:hypothetical protein
VAGSCELCNEPLGSVKCWEFLALELLASEDGTVRCGVRYDLTAVGEFVFKISHSFGACDFIILVLHMNFCKKLRSGFKLCSQLAIEE